jgi:hypothetical protein
MGTFPKYPVDIFLSMIPFAFFALVWGVLCSEILPAGIETNSALCRIGGCSSHVCGNASADIITTCEWTESYGCYTKTFAICAPNATAFGGCSWTMNESLLACLANPTATVSPTPKPNDANVKSKHLFSQLLSLLLLF